MNSGFFNNFPLRKTPRPIQATEISGCVNWIDMDQEGGAEGDAIGTLTDRSPSANNCTQATAGNKPLLRLNVANGKKGALFDGANDYLQFGTNIDLASTHTILFVMQPFYKNTYAPMMVYKQQGLYHSLAGTFNWGVYRSGDGYCGPIEGGQPQVFGLWGSSNSSWDFVHNYAKRTGSNTNAYTATATSYLGTDTLSVGNQVLSGLFFEMRVYNIKIPEVLLYASIDWLLYKWRGVIRQ